MKDRTDLPNRVAQFHMLELPGQPRMMHMGTAYLVDDLFHALKEVVDLADEKKLRLRHEYEDDIGNLIRRYVGLEEPDLIHKNEVGKNK